MVDTAPRLTYVPAPAAAWPLRIPETRSADEVTGLRDRVARATAAAQYGWGHTIDFGPFTHDGLLGTAYLNMVGAIDGLGWWPSNMNGMTVADIGAFSGGVAALLAARGAQRVHAIDEIPEHVEQCRIVADAFGLKAVEPEVASIYDAHRVIGPGTLDMAFVGGVLYHLSDMLAGLVRLLPLIRQDGWLVIETNAVECMEHSYANFGRFHAGMWWQPTGLCVIDMLRFAGFEEPEVAFYRPGRAIARARRGADDAPAFRRGLTIPFEDLRDAVERPVDSVILAPAPDRHAQVGMLGRIAGRTVDRALKVPLRIRRRIRRRRRT